MTHRPINPTNLEHIPAFPNRAQDPALVHAIIETPRDTRHKYAYEATYGAFMLKQVLPEGLTWPYDYGFVPQTRADDGDPIDILNMTAEATFTGCLVQCRVLGIVRIRKDGIRNDRLIAAPQRHHGVSQPTDDWEDVSDMPEPIVEGIIRFLVEYSAEQGHDIVCKGVRSRKRALEAIEQTLLS